MKKFAYFLIFLFNLLFISVVYAQTSDSTFTTYEQMHQKVVQYFNQQKYEEAADILDKHLDKFPEKLLANTPWID